MEHDHAAVTALASAWAPRHAHQEEFTTVVAPQPLVRPMSFLRFVAYGLGFIVVSAFAVAVAVMVAHRALAWLA